MKTGDVLMIYQDPSTQKEPEGKARLISKIYDLGDLEYWSVKFKSLNGSGWESATYERKIKKGGK